MNRLIYLRLAWVDLRKNRRLTWPYLLTCVCMVAMTYILCFLASPAVRPLMPKGADTVASILNMGQLVMALFALIFLFYTHSFLIRRRAREFGLYSVLGMSRRNLARVVTWESAITAFIALAGGLLLGVALFLTLLAVRRWAGFEGYDPYTIDYNAPGVGTTSEGP